MPKISVSTDKINELANEFQRNEISLTENPTDPRVNEFMELLSAYANKLFIKVFPVRDNHKRKDLVQEVCLVSMRRFNEFDPAKGSYSNVFYDNCERVRIDEFRRKSRIFRRAEQLDTDMGRKAWQSLVANTVGDTLTPPEQLIQMEDNLASLAEERKQHKIIKKLLGDKSPLTPRQKEVFKLQAEGFNQPQIGEKLGCSKENIRQIMDKIRSKAEQLMPDGGRKSPGR